MRHAKQLDKEAGLGENSLRVRDATLEGRVAGSVIDCINFPMCHRARRRKRDRGRRTKGEGALLKGRKRERRRRQSENRVEQQREESATKIARFRVAFL